MKDAIEAAIKALADKSKDAETPHGAMQFAQAALNLAQTLEALESINQL